MIQVHDHARITAGEFEGCEAYVAAINADAATVLLATSNGVPLQFPRRVQVPLRDLEAA